MSIELTIDVDADLNLFYISLLNLIYLTESVMH